MPDEFFTEQAKSSYHAYGAVTEWKNYQGLPMPEWEGLTDTIRAAWVNAVKQVYRDNDVAKFTLGSLYLED